MTTILEDAREENNREKPATKALYRELYNKILDLRDFMEEKEIDRGSKLFVYHLIQEKLYDRFYDFSPVVFKHITEQDLSFEPYTFLEEKIREYKKIEYKIRDHVAIVGLVLDIINRYYDILNLGDQRPEDKLYFPIMLRQLCNYLVNRSKKTYERLPVEDN